MFKKPKRNFRGRQRDSESDDENQSTSAKDDVNIKPTGQNDGSSGVRPLDSVSSLNATGVSTNQTKIKTEKKIIPKVPSASAVLSFEQEEEGEVFQIKKSTHSKRIVKQIKKETLKEKLEQPVKPEKVNGESSSSQATNEENGSPVADCEVIFDDLDDEDDDFSRSRSKASEPSVEEILKSGQIPDANMIHMVRKQRQMAREQGDDFIPIDDTLRYEKKSSRLIRDDDNDASESSGDENLALTEQQKETKRRHLQQSILAVEEGSHGEASDYERDGLEFEEQQIRKGVSIPAQQTPAVSTNMETYYYAGYQPYMYETQMLPSVASASAFMAYPGMDPSAATVGAFYRTEPSTDNKPISLELSKKKLLDRLMELTEIHRLHVHDRDEMGSRRDLTQESIERLTSQTMGLEEQFKFFQEMRGYVRDLVECMNEKMSSINYLERCLTNLWKDRAQKLVKRHQEDVKDQSIEYTFGKAGGTVPPAKDGSEEQARNRRKADREGRRSRRKRMREEKGMRDHYDGLSTDDEFSLSEIKKFNAEHERLVKDSMSAFDDVVDEFCKFNEIKLRFEMWKYDFSDSYNEAYIGLCLTKLFTPLIKLELISWNPLEPNCTDFEQSNWFSSLIFYGHSGRDLDVDDSDLRLIPNIIDKVLIPRLTVLVESVWNPLSLQSSHRLVKILRRLIQDYPTVNSESKNTQILIKAIVGRIKKTLDDDVFMPLYPKQTIENRNSGPAVFFYRQFWLCIKLLRSIVLWVGIVSQHQLQQLALDSLLNRYLVVALPNIPVGAESLVMYQAAVAPIPKDWFSDCKPGSTLPQLENFCRVLVNTATSLPRSSETKDMIKQIAKILVGIQANNHMLSLADRVGFRVVD